MNFFENQWIEIFRAGEQTDSAGNTRLWTDQDLKKMVKKYNEQKDHEAPLVVGHPKDNAPAFGWVEELKTDGEMLFAKFKQIVPEFIDAVKQGMYKKRSISLYPDLQLRHIGFLGAVPPAIKGLADIKFNEDENNINIEFEEIQDKTQGDKSMSKELEAQLASMQAQFDSFSEALKVKDTEISDLKKANDELKTAQEKENPVFKESQKEIETLKTELNAQKKANRIAEFKDFVNELHSEGKIVSEKQNDVIDLMEALHGVGEFNFSDKQESALERFKAVISAYPAMVDFSEKVKKEKLNKGISADAQLTELAEKKAQENKISFSEALSAVQLENPELAAKAYQELI